MGDGPNTGIFEFIEKIGGWYKSTEIKNRLKKVKVGLKNQQNEQIELD